MFHKVKSVTPIENCNLIVHFCNGVVKQYDVKKLEEDYPQFAPILGSAEVFKRVKVDTGGYGISWNDDVDLACDELWDGGEIVDCPFSGLMAFTDATQLWRLNESTLRKAISYGKLIVGVDVQKFSGQWVITREAMEREYGLPYDA